MKAGVSPQMLGGSGRAKWHSAFPGALTFTCVLLAWAPGSSAAQSKAPAECAATLSGEVSADDQARAFENDYFNNPGIARPLWQAATVRRCSLLVTTEPQARCLIGGEAKSLYDKFVQSAVSLNQASSVKKELADAKKFNALLTGELSMTCVEQAKAARQVKNFGLAAQLSEAAYVLTYKPNQLYNAARSCEDGQLWMEAEVYFTAYLSLDAAWRDRRDAVKKLVDIQRRLASDTGGQLAAARQSAERAEATAKAALSQAGRAETQAYGAAQNASAAQSTAQSAKQRAESADSRANQALQSSADAQSSAASARQAAGEAQRHAADAAKRVSGSDHAAQSAGQRAAEAQNYSESLARRVEALERELADLRGRLQGRSAPPHLEP